MFYVSVCWSKIAESWVHKGRMSFQFGCRTFIKNVIFIYYRMKFIIFSPGQINVFSGRSKMDFGSFVRIYFVKDFQSRKFFNFKWQPKSMLTERCILWDNNNKIQRMLIKKYWNKIKSRRKAFSEQIMLERISFEITVFLKSDLKKGNLLELIHLFFVRKEIL